MNINDVYIKKIMDMSRKQGCTCMYTREELQGFSTEKLGVICRGVKELGQCKCKRFHKQRDFRI